MPSYSRVIKKIQAHKIDLLVFAAGLLCLTLGLLAAYHTINYNSDDVVQKVLIHQTAEAHQVNVFNPPDNFVLKLPFNLVVDWLVKDPSKNIFISAWLMNAFALALFYVASLYFLRKYSIRPAARRVFWLLFLLLCANSSNIFLYDIRSPQIRTIEIGLAFCLLWAIDQLVLRNAKARYDRRLIINTALLAVLGGLFFYSDPAFLVFLIVPLAIVSALRYHYLGRDRLVRLGVTVAGMLLGYEIFNKLFTLLGVHLYEVPSNFVTWEKLGSNISIAMQGLLSLQDAMVFGLPLFKATTLLVVANLALLIIGAVYVPRKLGRDKDFWLPFFALQPIFLLLAYCLSNNVVNVYTSRYLILLPFYLVIMLTIGFQRYADVKNRRLVAGVTAVLCLLLLGQLSVSARVLMQNRHSNPNSYTEQVASAVESLHISKGYASYWNAGVNSFYSGYAANIFPLTCDGTLAKPYYWSVNGTAYDKEATQSFIIVANSKAKPASQMETTQQDPLCNDRAVIKQFGKPAKVRKVTDYTEIYIYNYDLLGKMPKRTNVASPV